MMFHDVILDSLPFFISKQEGMEEYRCLTPNRREERGRYGWVEYNLVHQGVPTQTLIAVLRFLYASNNRQAQLLGWFFEEGILAHRKMIVCPYSQTSFGVF